MSILPKLNPDRGARSGPPLMARRARGSKWRRPAAPCWGPRSALEQLQLESFGLRRRPHAELIDEPRPDVLVDPQRFGPVAAGRVKAHQVAVAGLTEGLQGHQLFGVADRQGEFAERFEAGDHALQRPHQLRPQLLAAGLGPGAVGPG